MLFVTGDVHHESLGTRDQAHLSRSEIRLARKYADIAGRHGVVVTLFVSGKTAREDPAGVAELAGMDHVEVGGHNWNCFQPSGVHRLSELLLGTYYGPTRYQRWDVRRTLDALETVTGVRPRSWRSHAFVGDERTDEVLAEAGIEVVSNAVGPGLDVSEPAAGILSLPINTLPDHSHVYHGWLSEEYVRRQRKIRIQGPHAILTLGRIPTSGELLRAGKETIKKVVGSRRRSSFPRSWSHVEEWERTLESQIEDSIDAVGFATVLAHPACMELADGMETFEQFCEFASNRETASVRRAADLLPEGP